MSLSVAAHLACACGESFHRHGTIGRISVPTEEFRAKHRGGSHHLFRIYPPCDECSALGGDSVLYLGLVPGDMRTRVRAMRTTEADSAEVKK